MVTSSITCEKADLKLNSSRHYLAKSYVAVEK